MALAISSPKVCLSLGLVEHFRIKLPSCLEYAAINEIIKSLEIIQIIRKNKENKENKETFKK
ncbi:hypothetical protein [Candidatus Phytoplasma asteris]|uniref:hypothetical protein n=1 Tax=Candidatus Phytoplasma asteris TaxID=85620 RepID=UPI003133A563